MYFNSSNLTHRQGRLNDTVGLVYWHFSSLFLTREISLMTKQALWVSNEYFYSHTVVFDGHY